MDLSSLLFLLWIFLGSWNSGANPWLACNQDNNLSLKIKGCTLIAEGKEWSPKNVALALTYRGLAYGYLGDDRAKADFDLAISWMDALIQRNSLDAMAFWIRGVAYRGGKNYARAFADYGEAIRLDPQHFDAFNSRCWARAILGTELEAARRDCDTAIRISNGAATYMLDSRAMVALKEGKFADAWADYDAALKAMPDYASALYGRGVAALRLGRTEEGNADFREALKLNPNIAKMFAAFGMTP